jgi:hypothetical protein
LSGNGSFVALPTVSANANFANFAGTAFNVSGSNVTGAVANATFATSAGTANSATVANSANSVAGANVSGTVANATFAANAGNATIANSANSVAVSNVSGIGNIATTNYDGNASNVLYGNGGFYALPTVSNVANANYANFAGTAFNVSGSNVSGEVANAAYANAANTANLATFATTANAVAGANVSGEVANANYSSYANIASSANSVALANVVGIGNIANINLDGNATNVLYGNGTFATIAIPSGTSISNGTSNVNIPVANGNVNISTNGNANIAQFDTNGALFLYPTTSSTNGLRINSYGNPTAGDVSRITSYRARGNAAAPLSVEPNDNLMRLLAFGHNGNIQQTSSTASIRAVVDASYTANTANIPIGWNMSVNDTNGGVNNQSKTHNFYSNGFTNLNGGLFTGNGITSRINENPQGLLWQIYNNSNSSTAQWTSWRYRGNSTSPLPVIAGDYILKMDGIVYADSGNSYVNTGFIQSRVANNDGAGNVSVNFEITTPFPNSAIRLNSDTINANGNLNSLGNFTSLNANLGNLAIANFFSGSGNLLSNIQGSNVSGEVANANYSSYSNIAATANSVAVANVVGIGNIATINLDGNASNVLFGNGVFAPTAGGGSNISNGTSNITIPTANANILFSTAGNANVVDIQAIGTFNVKPPAQGPLSAIRIDTYGRSGNVGAQRINSTRYRGNATTPLSVQANDFTMELLTVAYNGSNVQTNSIASFNAIVDNSYSTNGANIPLGWQLRVNDTNGGINNQSKIHNFYANGAVALVGNITGTGILSVTGNVTSANVATGDVSATGNVSANGTITGATLSSTGTITANSTITSNGTITGASLSSTGNISAVGNITANAIFSNGVITASGNLNSSGGLTTLSNGTGGRTLLYMFGDKTANSNFDIYDTQFSVTMQNVTTTGGFSPFRFQQYAPTSNQFGPMYFYRSRGNDFFTSAPVVANDKIMSLNFLVNSNNTTTSVGTFESTVTYNDNAGNVGMKYDIGALGTGTTGYLNGQINLLANTTTANNFSASNVSLSRFQETVYAIGNTSGTITPDFNNGSIQSMTLTGNITLNSLGNAVAGRSMTLIVTQDGTGNRTLTSSMLFAEGSKTLSTAASAKDIISVFYDGATYFASLTKGYA